MLMLDSSSGGRDDDDYDVLADGVVVGRLMKVHAAPVWPSGITKSRHTDARLRAHARGRDGGVRRLYFHVGNLSATA